MKIILGILLYCFIYSCGQGSEGKEAHKKLEINKKTEPPKGSKEDKEKEKWQTMLDKGDKFRPLQEKYLEEVVKADDPELLNKFFLAYYDPAYEKKNTDPVNWPSTYIKEFITKNLSDKNKKKTISNAVNLFVQDLKKDPNNEKFISELFGRIIKINLEGGLNDLVKKFKEYTGGSPDKINFWPTIKFLAPFSQMPKLFKISRPEIYFIEYLLFFVDHEFGKDKEKTKQYLKEYLDHIVTEYFANDKSRLKSYFDTDKLGETLLNYLMTIGLKKQEALDALGGVWSL